MNSYYIYDSYYNFSDKKEEMIEKGIEIPVFSPSGHGVFALTDTPDEKKYMEDFIKSYDFDVVKIDSEYPEQVTAFTEFMEGVKEDYNTVTHTSFKVAILLLLIYFLIGNKKIKG